MNQRLYGSKGRRDRATELILTWPHGYVGMMQINWPQCSSEQTFQGHKKEFNHGGRNKKERSATTANCWIRMYLKLLWKSLQSIKHFCPWIPFCIIKMFSISCWIQEWEDELRCWSSSECTANRLPPPYVMQVVSSFPRTTVLDDEQLFLGMERNNNNEHIKHNEPMSEHTHTHTPRCEPNKSDYHRDWQAWIVGWMDGGRQAKMSTCALWNMLQATEALNRAKPSNLLGARP